jgi:hypothetical protein
VPDYVQSFTIRVSPRWTPSRVLRSECVSIAADGTRTVFAPAGETRERAPRAPRVAAPTTRDIARELLMSLPTIHEEEGL